MTGMLRRAVMLASCGLLLAGSVAAEDKVKVKFGVLKTASQAAFYVGAKKGIFAKYGFDVEVLPLATGVQANQALAAGQADWSGGGVESTVVAWATKLPFKAYSMYAKGGDSYGILVRKESHINSSKDLKGKKIAVPQGTAPAQGLNQVLKEAGLPPDSVMPRPARASSRNGSSTARACSRSIPRRGTASSIPTCWPAPRPPASATPHRTW